MKITEFEKKALELKSEKEFVEFLNKEKNLKLEKESVDIRKEEKVEENSYVIEEIVSEYLEEISYIQQLSQKEIDELVSTLDEDESVEKLSNGSLREIANIAFDYLISGIDYLDLVQEGTIGLMQGIENYKPSNGNIVEYLEFWIRRAMLHFINERVENDKIMYKTFFTKKRDEVLEHEIVEELEENEEKNEEINETTESLNKKIAYVDEVDYTKISRKLSHLDEEVLKRYYGLIGEKRESLFEIENELNLERGSGEKIFEEALAKISLGGGRTFKI